ncbi:hypothetical protein BaRGS_00028001 [Batillaria attramentaria]|uniref:Uncharacterized protein n=1 Tax=Batillaria attramentaria TaxID=370345 RepID=A0ABD0K050_9CAEN
MSTPDYSEYAYGRPQIEPTWMKMRFERHRLASFVDIPSLPPQPFPIWSVKLAASGYYLDNAIKKILCFYCSECPYNHKGTCNRQRCNVCLQQLEAPDMDAEDLLGMMNAVSVRRRQTRGP